MKRLITIILLLIPVLFACTDLADTGSKEVTGVVLSKDKVDLLVGESVTITATVMPESLDMGVVWSVLDPQYADVKAGTVTGKAEGVTYVIATSADGSKKAACLVSVNPPLKYSVSIKDSMGQSLSGIYGYPGMTVNLSAVTSDEQAHTFTWSLDDDSVGAITSDGVLTLAASASTADTYLYDAQSSVKVVTEDGCGCKIPVRSSLLNGVIVDQSFEPAGTPVIVQKDGTYPVSAAFQGAFVPESIPADAVTLELSSSTGFTLQKEAGGYSLMTGSSTGVSTKLSVSIAGVGEKTEIAQFRIDKVYKIKAQLAGRSSSTLVFTWTEGGEVADDISKPYTISLYKDEDCTDLEVSYSIPAGDGCWKGRQPKFVLSGLEPGTDYWFQVKDTSGEDMDSPVIPATTEAFNIVMVSDDPANVGDVILAEDFGQLCWGADEINEAAGFEVVDDSYGYNSNTGKSFTCREAAMFVGSTSQYARFSLTAQTTAKKEAGFRLAKWAQGQYGRMYVGPGYVFLSTKSYGTHIITPELASIPDGMTAKLKVTLHASGKESGGKAALAVQHNKSFYEISSNNQTNKNKLDLTSNVQTITYSGGITNLEAFEVTIDGVVSGDRIAFGPISESNPDPLDNSNMMLLSDITVQIIELQ
ncbi:MAG: Ig-like domain-containing protein [Bacteroidales bacterium]|nr:Ig-like domain-containing protein [Bacteroidales bacterium]